MKLERMVFLGRTYAEYMDMFGLTEDDLRRGPVLDCPAGPSSFTAEAHAMGIDAKAADIAYGAPAGELEVACRADMNHVYNALDASRQDYVWDYYKDTAEVRGLREKALSLFASDYATGLAEGRYIKAGLPHLPFPDRAFRLVLSGHFLFLFAQWLSIDFHLECLRELMRVSSDELRVFPIQDIGGGQYDYLGYIVSTLEDEGIRAEVTPGRLEFQRGSNLVLRLRHP